MGTGNVRHGDRSEELLAEVAAATCRATLQHGFKGAFIDVALDLWQAAQARLRQAALQPGASAG
jgi:hypothetical protein